MKNVVLLFVCMLGVTVHALACNRSYVIDLNPCVVGDIYRIDYCGQTWDARANGCATHPDEDPMTGYLEGGSILIQVSDSGSHASPTLGGYVYATFRYYVKVSPGFNAGGVNYSYSAYFYFYHDCFDCPWYFN